MIMPGVQNPHWSPCFSQKAFWSGWSAPRRRHALDGDDARPVGLRREHRAALHRPAVDVDRARAALARVTADVRPGEAEILPDDLDEEPPRLDVHLPALAVHLERDVQLAHQGDLLSPVVGGGGDAWSGGVRGCAGTVGRARGGWMVPPRRPACNRDSRGAATEAPSRRGPMGVGASAAGRRLLMVRGSRPSATACSAAAWRGTRRGARASAAGRQSSGVSGHRGPRWPARRARAAAVRRRRVVRRPHELGRLVGPACRDAARAHTMPRSPGTARTRCQLSGPGDEIEQVRLVRRAEDRSRRPPPTPSRRSSPSIAWRPGASPSRRAGAPRRTAALRGSAPIDTASGSSTTASGQPAAPRARQLARQQRPRARGCVRGAAAATPCASPRRPSVYGPGMTCATTRSVSAAVADHARTRAPPSRCHPRRAPAARRPPGPPSGRRRRSRVRARPPPAPGRPPRRQRSIAARGGRLGAFPVATASSSTASGVPSAVTLGQAPLSIANIARPSSRQRRRASTARRTRPRAAAARRSRITRVPPAPNTGTVVPGVGPGRTHSERIVGTRLGRTAARSTGPVTQAADVGHVVDVGHDEAQEQVEHDQRRELAQERRGSGGRGSGGGAGRRRPAARTARRSPPTRPRRRAPG